MNNKLNTEHYNEKSYDKQEAYEKAKKRVGQIKGFYWHLLSYVIINAIILYLIAENVTPEQFWTFHVFSTIIYWGIGVFFHFIGVFGKNVFFGKDWEDRKIQEYLDKEEKQNWE